MDKIEIYTNETCPYCKQIKEKLTEENIEFENKLTEDFTEEYQKIVSLVGVPTVPIIKYKDEYFLAGRDFQNPQQLINIFETFDNSSYDDSRRTLERMKTLNWHINTAFGRVDQLLRQIENKLNTEEDEHKSTD
tara:strand:+ start:50 stop:451 length:402 start_codon:yes stop_codon:yes gene_type:complete